MIFVSVSVPFNNIKKVCNANLRSNRKKSYECLASNDRPITQVIIKVSLQCKSPVDSTDVNGRTALHDAGEWDV